MRDVTRFTSHDFAASSLVRDRALRPSPARGNLRALVTAGITGVAFIAATLSTAGGYAHAGQHQAAPASSDFQAPVSPAADATMGAASPAGAGSAPAASTLDPEQRAMELFRKGSELYSNAQYSAALDAFLDAQTLYPSPDFHYNIGACHEQLENYDQAVRSFQSYLRNRPDAPDRANIEARVARLQRLVAGQNARPAAGQAPMSTATNTDPSRTSDRDVVRPTHPGRGLIITGGTVLAIGAVAGVTGAAIYGQRARREDKILAALAKGDNPNHLTFEEARTRARNGQRAENLQFITAGIGGGVAIVGAVLLGLGLYKKNATARALTTGAQSWRSQLRPAVAFDQRHHRVHLSVQGAF